MSKTRLDPHAPADQASKDEDSALLLAESLHENPRLLLIVTEVTRKLNWALTTTWHTHTGHRPPRGIVTALVDPLTISLVLKMAVACPRDVLGPSEDILT